MRHHIVECGVRPWVANAANVEEQLFQRLIAQLHIPPDCKSRVLEHLGRSKRSAANEVETARLKRVWRKLKRLKVWGNLSDEEYLVQKREILGIAPEARE